MQHFLKIVIFFVEIVYRCKSICDISPMKTALFTIGSEITSGEITNTNSVWMSEQLEALGFSVSAQLSVPDDPKLIQWALDNLSAVADLIFVSGGLGPTSDDITRQELAKWCKKTLIFNESVFADLTTLLTSRGVPIREGHKQQCFFQQGSELLKNTTGTALGFFVNEKSVKIFVLPGPPRELEPMWQNEVLPRLANFPRDRDFGVKRWILNNVPESEAAKVVEEAMKGCDVVIGYRAAKPTVRVKIRYRLSDTKAQDQIAKLDKVLSLRFAT